MSDHLRRHGWRYFLVGGTAALGLMLTSRSTVVYDVIYLALGSSVVAAIAVGVRVHRPRPTAPWIVMAVAQTIWVAADATYFLLVDVLHRDSFPSLADAFYLLAYPALLASIYLLVRSRPKTGGPARLFDSAIMMAGLSVGFAALLTQPGAASLHDSFATALVSLAYPVFDILLIGGLVALVVTDTTRAWALRLLLAACVLLVGADSLSIVVDADTFVGGRLLDGLWVGSYVIWGAAVLHPSLGFRVRARDASSTLSGKRLIAMVAASLAPPLVLVFEWLAGLSMTVWPLAFGSIVLSVLVLARMALLVREVAQVTRRSDALQEELEFRATHDELTRLPNRSRIVSRISSAIADAERRGEMVGVLFVDLDGFKQVNDTFGHGAGDGVLRAVASRLSSLAGAESVAARLGGDEFVVLLPALESPDEARRLADRIIDDISEPIELDVRQTVRVGASVGIAYARSSDSSAEAILHEADLALYQAKELGRGRALTYSDLLRREYEARAEFEGALHRAMAQDEFVLHYQPIRDVRTGRMTGAEALLRWDRPGVGLLLPGEFLPAAEASDLVCDIDVWVVKAVLAQLEAWADHPDLTVSVNIAVRHVLRPRVVVDIREALLRSDVPPRRLVLEISELALSGDGPVLNHLAQLRELGVGISLSDFGAGVGAMGDLGSLPVDSVKIGRDVINAGSSHLRPMLELMVGTARSAGLPVVGEGVERLDQLALLEEVDCESAQGFFLGMPTTADRLMVPGAIPALDDGSVVTAS